MSIPAPQENLHSAKPKTFIGLIVRTILMGFIGKAFFGIITFVNKYFSALIFYNYYMQLYTKCEADRGIFKGLKYFEPTSACGPLIPRLIGTYEAEIIPTLKEFKNNTYSKIINIGAAEGYYAIGLSIVFPSTPIIAYETDKPTFKYLNEMVVYNNKQSQIESSDKLCIDYLKQIDPKEKLLIFSDCEGCEFEIFNKEIIHNLLNSDLIIEMHNKFHGFFLNLDKTELELKNNFSNTHYIEKIGLDKHLINIEDFSNLDIKMSDFAKIYSEHREKSHHFLVLRSKKHY